jgi:solute carrier family 15 (peptide/histidine transporter), member 3/4
VNFGFENMASLSLAVNLMMYFLGVMHLNLEDASNLLTNYMGASYMISVLISIFADVFVGRYMTVILSSLVELVVRTASHACAVCLCLMDGSPGALSIACVSLQGLLLLMLQARSDRLKPPPCKDPRDPTTCPRVHGSNEVHLYLALYLIALGSGGIKAALPAHCADQFDAKHPREKLQMSSCFNYLLLSLCTGGAFSVTVFVWIQENKGWAKGFAAATGVMGLAVIVFIAGLPRYRIATVQGSSALKEIFQVYVAAVRNRKQQLPENPDELYEISKNKASPDTEFVAHRDRPFRSTDTYYHYHAHMKDWQWKALTTVTV